MNLIFPILLLGVYSSLAVCTGIVARDKGRSFVFWAVIGFLVPALGLFFAVLINDESGKRAFPDPRERTDDV